MLGLAQLSLLPKGAVVVNTARGPIVDIDAVATLLKSGHLAGVGLDVLPVEPPVEPVPELMRAYRARETVDRGPADHHAALGVLLAGSLGGHPGQIRRDDAGRAAGAEAAERGSTRRVLSHVTCLSNSTGALTLRAGRRPYIGPWPVRTSLPTVMAGPRPRHLSPHPALWMARSELGGHVAGVGTAGIVGIAHPLPRHARPPVIARMAVLVTGAAGFVALNVVEHLLRAGREVVGLDRIALPARATRVFAGLPGRLTMIGGSVLSDADLSRALTIAPVDRVIHCAVITAGSAREKAAPETIVAVNVQGAVAALLAAARRGVRRFVYPSSGSIYGTAAAGVVLIGKTCRTPRRWRCTA